MKDKYDVDYVKLREEIEELLKYRVNEILNNGGPFTLASALDNYRETRQLAIKNGIDVEKYDKRIKQLESEVMGVIV